MIESHARSLAKAVTYRVLGSLSTAAMVFLFTGSVKLSLGAGALDSIVKITLYFLHERLWDHIPFGRHRAAAPEYEI
jgi:adenylylsulfate kinase